MLHALIVRRCYALPVNRASISAHPIVSALLKLSESRRFTIASIVGVSGFGLWLLFLAAIGFYYGMVPSDAFDHMTGQPRIVRWLDEAICGVPIERFYSWSSLLAGLAVCACAMYSAWHLPAPTHESNTRND